MCFPVCVCVLNASCTVCLHLGVCLSTGQCVWGLDHSVLLLPSGCMSDDKRDEEENEDTDVSCVHYPWVLLKKQKTEENEASPSTTKCRKQDQLRLLVWIAWRINTIWGLNLLFNVSGDAPANKSSLPYNIQRRLERTKFD